MTKPNITVIQPTILESNEKIRSAAYCRVSSDSTDQLNSYMAQIRYYENFLADSETETLVAVYADEGVSGTRADKREEFQRLMKDCRKGKIDRIYAKSISRFARNTRDCLLAVRELRELGITIFFEKESIDTANISDEMMVTIMGALAQEESNSISQNMRWSCRKRMKNGKYKISTPPYGYKLVRHELVIDENEVGVVRKIFHWYLSGYGLTTIANMLNSHHIASNYSKEKWYANSVRYILTNERYIGDALFQKTYKTEAMPFKKVINYGEKEKIYVRNTNPPIIEKTDFEKVQQMVNNYEHEHIPNSLKYALSQKIVCARCGIRFKRKKCNHKIYWVCRNHNEKADNCEIKQILESKFYDAFMRLYNKLKCNYIEIFPPLLSQLQELKNKKFSGSKQFTEINIEIAKLKEQIHVLTRLKTKRFLDEGKYFEQTNEINRKLNKLAKELQKITRCDDDDDIINQIQELADFIENGVDLMSEFDEIMFESLVEKIVVKSMAMIEFQLYGGLKFEERI